MTETTKKPPVKKAVMSGLAGLRKNLGVADPPETPGDEKKEGDDNQEQKGKGPIATEDNSTGEIVSQVPVVQITELQDNISIPKDNVKTKITDLNRPPFESFFKRTDVNFKKETVNISPKNKECLKLLSTIEKSTINSMIENIIDWYFITYNDEIVKVPGMKEILKKYRK